ncbi:MAG: NERD domain-containing protein [Kiritimatiellia bacterium]|jgi:restriction system protein
MDQLIKAAMKSFGQIWTQNPLLFTLVGLILIFTPIFRMPGVKGWFGEMLMRLGFKLSLPKDVYRVINNVTIPDGRGGTTQIDHIVVSPYGVFVVETKHYKGWIFGGEHDRQWTQKIHGGHSQKFQNPLLQNYKHTECLRELLGLSKEQVKSVIVFTGECTLKTRDKLPTHVTHPGSCVRYISSHRDILFDVEAVTAVEAAIRENRLTPGWKTARQHKAYVQSLRPAQQGPETVEDEVVESAEVPTSAEPQQTRQCPKCGADMVLRTARRGAKAGSQFWGCSNYPRCRHVQ